MGKINWGRVILGGLLAGLVINVVEWISPLVFREDYQDFQAAMEAIGKSGQPGPGELALYIVMNFAVGIFAIWLYAAIRPRYSPGPKTAVIAACGTWFAIYFVATIGYAQLGIFPGRLLAITVVVGLVEILVATQLGAWLYKEAAASH